MSTVKFFIVGCPRSGTTLIQQALNRHSRIAIPPETAFLSLLSFRKRIQEAHLQRINHDLGIDLVLPQSVLREGEDAQRLFEELVRRYTARIAKPGVTHFGEKTPEHLNRVGCIERLFPGSKIILVFRDGRDVALSLRQLPWTSRDLYVNYALWLYCYRLQRRVCESCPLPVLFVRYEDVAGTPAEQFGRILRFLDLPYEPAVACGEGNADGVPSWEAAWKGRSMQKITNDRIGIWRTKLTAQEIGILERWGGTVLQALGYSLVTNGRQALPWLFYPRVAIKSLHWLVTRPAYAYHRALWEERNEGEHRRSISCNGEKLT